MATSGRFTLTNGMLIGPETYINERGNQKLADILAGKDEGFEAMQRFAPIGTSTEHLIVTALQTDYAAWIGARMTLLEIQQRRQPHE